MADFPSFSELGQRTAPGWSFAGAAEREPASAPNSTLPTVLVVDDDPTVRLCVSELLRANGFRASEAANGAAALASAEQVPPDLILLDVMLPDIDGLALCQQLKAQPATAAVPVIFLTARGEDAEMVHGFAAGGVDYIVKPFDVALLLARVRTHTSLARLSRGLAAALDERTASLEEANRRLRAMHVDLALIEERERQRLAQELHDTSIQQLVLARILCDVGGDPARDPSCDHSSDPSSAPTGAATGPTPTDPPHRRVRDLIDLTLQQLRTLVFDLAPPVLRLGGLESALEWLADTTGTQWQLPVQVNCSGSTTALPQTATLVLFQGARELLINCAKHAQARHAEIDLWQEPDQVTLQVSDDGIGFDAAKVRGQQGADEGGFGLRSLRARVERLGGHIDIASTDSGSRVCIRLPLNAPQGS